MINENLSCQSQYCFYWGKYELAHCKRCTQAGSIAFTQECRANRKKIAVEEMIKKMASNREQAIEEGSL